MGGRPHLVAKLGGSLHASPMRAAWLAALRRWPHRLTIVCGGGPFADAVRAAQPKMDFSDATAHKMAMLAMEQYALALAGLHDGLTLAATPDEIAAAHAAGHAALWRPSEMAGAAPDVGAAWDVTSDSLSAWLARRLAADALMLIKSVDARNGAEIVSREIVDPAFVTYATNLSIYLAGPGALAGAPEVLAKGAVAGTPIDLTPLTKIAS